MARIVKAQKIQGKNIYFKNVTCEDAEFLLNLRLDAKKGKYLSPTSPHLTDQIAWIKSYEASTDQAYFVICSHEGERLGCIRMYDPDEISYVWGSWILKDGISALIAIESALMIYAYGLTLGFQEVRLDVRKNNKSVWKFHEKVFNVEKIHETDIDIFYRLSQQGVMNALKKLSKYTRLPLQITPME